jgi:hypothetical protein
MVVRNGWYIWRVRHPKPGFKNGFKWHVTVLLLTIITLISSLGSFNFSGIQEALGRFLAWGILFFKKPILQ